MDEDNPPPPAITPGEAKVLRTALSIARRDRDDWNELRDSGEFLGEELRRQDYDAGLADGIIWAIETLLSPPRPGENPTRTGRVIEQLEGGYSALIAELKGDDEEEDDGEGQYECQECGSTYHPSSECPNVSGTAGHEDGRGAE